MKSTEKIEFSEHCNLNNFEKLLQKFYKDSLNKKKITFIFANLKWIGPLQINLIYEWVAALVKNNVEVEVKFISTDHNYGDICYLSEISFEDELIALGASITKKPQKLNAKGLAAFKIFNNKDELIAYEQSLETKLSFHFLLGEDGSTDLIRDGDFKEIVIHELGENSFIHGLGKNVRFSVREFPASNNRKPHKILSQFGGNAFIETVVSDSGPGLIRNLKKQVPKGFLPDKHFTSSRKLSQDALTVLYAFEFSSTSDEEGRRKRLKKIFEKAQDAIDVIPTGLFYLGSLAKLYGGQIIVRTGRALISFDYTTSEKNSIYSQSNLTSINGTHILVRVPKQRSKIAPVKWKKQFLSQPGKEKAYCFSLGEIAKNHSINSDFIFHAEKNLIRSYVAAQQKGVKPLVILCDGVHPDTKTFSYFFVLLSVIPRRSRSLIVMGLRSELFEVAKLQWEKIKNMRHDKRCMLGRVQGYSSFIIVSSDFSQVMTFGDQRQTDSTLISDQENPTGEHSYNLNELIYFNKNSILGQLKSLIKRPPIKHPDKFYLIESKYYTPTFYEIGKLVDDKLGSELSESYLKIILQENNIGSVFVISEPLFNFVSSLEKDIPNITWTKREIEYERSSFMEAITSWDKDKTLMIMSDVICSGSEIDKYLGMLSHFKNIVIFCFVDGREENLPYYIVKGEEQAYSPPLLSIYSDPIVPINDLTGDDVSNILIIDPRTHAPTSYDHIETPELSSQQLLQKCEESNSLYCGHLSFRGKHYSAFLFFAQLFKSIAADLYEWWDSTIMQLTRKNINLKDVTIHYLDEKRGYEKTLYNFFSTKGIGKVEALERRDLIAPPPRKPIEDKKYIWFILPAMASGNTVMRCLEYASRYDVKEVYVSIMISRVDPTRLSFYQNITGYRNCQNVKIETLSCLPVPAYSSTSHCPQCTISKLLGEIKRKVSGYNYLSNIIKKGIDLFELKRVLLEELGPDHSHSAGQNDYKKILMSQLYVEARRSVELRKTLTSMLKEPNASKLFIEMIGAEFISDEYSKPKFMKIIYDTHYHDLMDEALRILNESGDNSMSIKCILGIHCLFPQLLLENIKNCFIVAFKKSNQETCNSILFLALVEAEKYGLSIASIDEFATEGFPWKVNLIKDLRAYPFWHESEHSASVNDFIKLLWLLRRSTPWGSSIEYLRAVIQTKSSKQKEMIRAASVFSSGGVKSVIHLLGRLKSREQRRPGNLWSVILSENNNIESVIQRIETIDSKILSIVENEDTDQNRDNLLLAVRDIDDQGHKLLDCLQKIFTNPIDVEMKIKEIGPQRWPNSKITARFKVADDQPGILIGLEDLIQCVSHILDNANDCVNGQNGNSMDDFWIEFNFSGYTKDKEGACLLIRDNLPWVESISLSGGMKQFVDYCEKYAAVYDFSLNPSDVHQKIFVIYKIDDKRERHGKY